MLPVNHDYWDVLNLTPPSDDVAEGITAESEQRMQTVQRFGPFVEMYAVLCADILTQVLYKNMAVRMDLSNPQVHTALENWHVELVNQNREVIRGAVYPILAAMLEADMIDYGEKAK